MRHIESRLVFDADSKEVFKFIANPKNFELVYPRVLALRIIEVPESMGSGSTIHVRGKILGQTFSWHIVVEDFKEADRFISSSSDSIFKRWRHVYRVSTHNGKCVLEDKIEFETVLGFIFDRFAERVLENILNYRNAKIRKLFEKDYQPIKYKDPLSFDFHKGTFLCTIMTLFGLLIPIIVAPYGFIIDVIVYGIAWLFLWFFTHDLAHILLGLLLGVRFSNFYIGISNIVNGLPIKPMYKILFIVLGVKIDRIRSNTSNRGYALMYLVGPLASIFVPFYVPLVVYSKDPYAATFLLLISIFNLVTDSIMSPRYGCIKKAITTLKRP